MNYYEHHLGDYLRDTAHLSMLEDSAYRRLLDAYYIRERALPLDQRDCCKLARATSKPERDAVAYVLREFFQQEDDGYHQKRADAEIAKYLESEPDREARRQNERERQRLARERRKEVFATLQRHGVTPAYDATMSELRAMLARAEKRVTTGVTSQPVTRDVTATQTPVPSNQEQQGEGGQSEGKGKSEGDDPPHALSETRSAFDQRMPEDWAPTADTLGRIARARPDLVPVLDAVTEKFRLYAQSTAGYGGLSRDWQVSFRKWVLNERQHKPGSSGGKQSDLEARNKAVADAWEPPEVRDATA